jgi:hypothetical protein
MHRNALFPAAVLGGILLLAGCADRAAPTAAHTPAASAAHTVREDEVYPMEEEMAELARRVPGFGGMGYDGQGNAIVRLVDARQRATAAAAVEPLMRAAAARERRSGTPRVVVRQGRYEFMQLVRWRNRMTDAVLAVPGVMYAGIGYGENRLTVGLVPSQAAAARTRVEGAVAKLGIPTEAVLFDVGTMNVQSVDYCLVDDPDCTADPCIADPAAPGCSQDPCPADPSLEGCPEPYPGDGNISPSPEPSYSYIVDPNYVYMEPSVKSLLGTVRPLRGAVRISKGSGGACSVGFVADYDGRRVFSTASHCGYNVTFLDGTEWHQPEVINNGYTKFVGRESSDPQANAYNSRYSDLAFNAVASGVTANVGYISRTRGGPVTGAFARGTTDIDPGAEQIRITGEGSLVEAQYFEKIGSRTGWTRGKSARPCQNVSQWGRTFYCSTWVSGGADHGDSGAPVFRNYLGFSCRCVYLVGIAFATTPNGGMWVSPISGIRRDFQAQGSQAYRLRTY